MTNITLMDMSTFFIANLYDNIPSIPVSFAPHCKLEGALGEFTMDPAKDYLKSKDELFNSPGYRIRWQPLLDNTGYDDIEEESWKDPLNHPITEIKVSDILKDYPLIATAVLLHELTHYWSWYMGYEYQDTDYAFNAECIRRGLPTNFYENVFIDGSWSDTYDYSQMSVYIDAYIRYAKGEPKHTGSKSLILCGFQG